MDINIDAVKIIVKKTEDRDFDFHNEKKEDDGFVLFTEGSVRYFRPGHEPKTLCAGDLVLQRKGNEYRFFSRGPCAYVTAAFSFSEASESALNPLPDILRASGELQNKIAEAERTWQTQRWDRDISVRILLLEIYRELLRQTRTTAAPGERIAEGAKEYLHLHFRENFTTAQIARYCNVSEPHLRAVFKQETGMSVTEFRNLLRIRSAKEMLSSRLFTVKETAEALGYCDVFYFSKNFKQLAGISPAQFLHREHS